VSDDYIDVGDHLADLARRHGIAEWDDEDLAEFGEAIAAGASPAQVERLVADWVAAVYQDDDTENADGFDWDDSEDFDEAQAVERWQQQFGLPDAPEPEPEIDLSEVDWDSMDPQEQARVMAQRAHELNDDSRDPDTGLSLDGEFDFRRPGDRDRYDALRVSGVDVTGAHIITGDDDQFTQPAMNLEQADQ
jgi:hypothetical protein